jgi:hypothetical protein
MTDQRERERAAGYIYAYEQTTDTHALLFGQSGTSLSDVFYQVTLAEGDAPSRQFGLQMHGDFAALLDSGVLNQIGQMPVSLQVQANAQRFSVRFDPDPLQPGNALFRTTTGLQGAVIRTHNSPWAIVAGVAIVAIAVVTVIAIAENTNATVEATVTTPVGSASATINVNGRPPAGGGGGE